MRPTARNERHLPINSTAACFFEPFHSDSESPDVRWTLSAEPSLTNGSGSKSTQPKPLAFATAEAIKHRPGQCQRKALPQSCDN